MSKYKKNIFVAMSGGVDSSVAALLLKKQGYAVTGVFMRCFNLDGCAERDAEDARRVAAHIGIPFYVFDFEKEYKEAVVEYMVKGYREGITPNPDVMCNKEIKFGIFLKKALAQGADYIATGHYVQISRKTHQLSEAKDKNKDQSYFLWTLTLEQLKHCLFPIGEYQKSEVRDIARKAGLPTAEKKDSQGICFLGKVTLKDFLKDYIAEEKGAVVTTSGKTIGEHHGAHLYTIGERHIGVSSHTPVYVVEKNVKTNIVVVAEGNDDPTLFRGEVLLVGCNFISSDTSESIKGNKTIAVRARVRYRQPLFEAKLSYDGTHVRLTFDAPQKFVASGQSAVFYSKKGEMLGGGVII